MPRLFTAIEIPSDLRTRLALLGAPMNGARWLDPDNLHITLRFAGDIENRQAAEWADLLARIEMPAFRLTITGLGAFGGRTPRVIWAGVEASDELARLHAAHERAARVAGLPPETRNFRPHVTLARLRGTRPETVARFLQSRGGLHMPPFTATRIVLLSSKPGTGGGPYVVEDAYPLGDGFEAYDNDNDSWLAGYTNPHKF